MMPDAPILQPDDHADLTPAERGVCMDAVVAVAFVAIGLRLWSTRSERPALEASFLRGAWYVNELYDTVFGRPSGRLAAFCADVVDPKIIDGAVNGVAGAFRGSGSLLRRTQTGWTRYSAATSSKTT